MIKKLLYIGCIGVSMHLQAQGISDFTNLIIGINITNSWLYPSKIKIEDLSVYLNRYTGSPTNIVIPTNYIGTIEIDKKRFYLGDKDHFWDLYHDVIETNTTKNLQKFELDMAHSQGYIEGLEEAKKEYQEREFDLTNTDGVIWLGYQIGLRTNGATVVWRKVK